MSDSKNNLYRDEALFALDIGTRTVIGIVCVREADNLKIIASEMMEHGSRSMIDGQVHDIAKVAGTVEIVKEKLEKRVGFKLKRVAIAAAGRVLKTVSTRASIELDNLNPITPEVVTRLEMEGIQKAQIELNNDVAVKDASDFYCVGYSVINYYLNGYMISNPVDHKGKNLAIDILATFLPHTVVDSLYAVTNKVDLEVVSLTLEPIAAINVVIPEDLRLLNLALVDIGAGTSDIAITKTGSIVAYGMVPVAGDEITERIVQRYLVDFNTAEKMKLQMSTSDVIKFQDIIGIEYELSREELEETIKPAVENLTDEIASKILDYNDKSPNAVFCVGGGSLVKGFTELLAKKLNLPEQRVAIRTKENINGVELLDGGLEGPSFVTVIGIAKTAESKLGHDFVQVVVDGRPVRLFKSKDIKVADAIALTGFNPKDLIGKTGKTLIFNINGEKKIIRGEYGNPAEIYLNQKSTSLDADIEEGDIINIIPCVNGKNAEAYLKDYVKGFVVKRVAYNNSLLDISTKVDVNGETIRDLDRPINTGDIINIIDINTLGEIINTIGANPDEVEFYVNGNKETLDYKLNDGDKIDAIPIRKAENVVSRENNENAGSSNKLKGDNINPKMKNIEHAEPEAHSSGRVMHTSTSDFVNKVKQLENDPEIKKLLENGNRTVDNVKTIYSASDEGKMIVYVNDKKIMLDSKKSYMFVDIFNHIDFDLTKPKGNIILKLNGKKASFTDRLNMGDKIEISWG